MAPLLFNTLPGSASDLPLFAAAWDRPTEALPAAVDFDFPTPVVTHRDAEWDDAAAEALLADALETLGANCPADYEGTTGRFWERCEAAVDQALAARRWTPFVRAVERWVRCGLRSFERHERTAPPAPHLPLDAWFETLPVPQFRGK